MLSLSLQGDVAGLFSLVDQLEKDLPLALHFLGLVSHDILMLPYAPMKSINVDKLDELGSLRAKRHDAVWHHLRQSIQDVLGLYRTTRIQLAFHVKSLLVEILVGA
jgi:hypothetical protein